MQKQVAIILMAMVMGSLCHSSTNHDSLEELFSKWSSWKAKHQRTYSSSEEESYRFQVWQANKRDIEENPGDGYTRALNMFSDMTKAEWRSIYINPIPIIDVKPEEEEEVQEHYQVPNSVDWDKQGKTQKVVSQGQCGSCWSFSTMGTYNAAVAIKTGTVGDFSQQQLVSCSGSYGNGGCGGGVVLWGLNYIKDKSVCTNADYPYTSGKSRDTGKCNSTKEKACVGKNPKIKENKRVASNNCDALAAAAATTPIGVAVDADRWGDYDSGIFSSCGDQINHAVTLTGFVKGKYWKIANSWGADWGESGYMRIKWGPTCGICKQNFYPVLE